VPVERPRDETRYLIALGKRVRARRKKLGLSQRELAERAGVQVSYIGGIETGTRNVGAINLGRLARALEYPNVGELLDGLSL
jgi:transcriptional regulator with XRE-family HTH domain